MYRFIARGRDMYSIRPSKDVSVHVFDILVSSINPRNSLKYLSPHGFAIFDHADSQQYIGYDRKSERSSNLLKRYIRAHYTCRLT